MLNAIARVANPNIHLALAGEGKTRPAMEKLAQQLGIDERVHFLGYRRDIPTLIQAADAVLLVSEQEGLPRSVMEAMCLNTLVIGSNIRGTQDLLKDDCGLLVELGNTEQLAQAIIKVVENSDLIGIIEKAKIKVKDYNLEQILRQYVDLYQLALTNER